MSCSPQGGKNILRSVGSPEANVFFFGLIIFHGNIMQCVMWFFVMYCNTSQYAFAVSWHLYVILKRILKILFTPTNVIVMLIYTTWVFWPIESMKVRSTLAPVKSIVNFFVHVLAMHQRIEKQRKISKPSLGPTAHLKHFLQFGWVFLCHR
jgi:hypothetical protein